LIFLHPLKASTFEFKGFADVTFNYTDNKQDTTDRNTNGAFSLGHLDLYLSHSLNDRIDVLGEILIEGEDNGEFEIDLERLQISYYFRDEFIVRAGRFHNVLGYWNTAYHHGSLLYTTIDRPSFLQFDDQGGVLPTHLIGLWLTGRLSRNQGTLEYSVMAGNGPKIKNAGTTGSLDPNSVSDNNKNKALSFHLEILPSKIEGLGIGISGNFSEIQFFDIDGNRILVGGANQVIQEILSADLEYSAKNIELIAEGYQIRDHGSGASHFINYAWYIQGGYKFLERVTPYVRHERFTIHEEDPYFLALGKQDKKITVAGIRFDIMAFSALKAEVRLVDSTDHYEEYAVQWAFAF
jgi:hypothetical protein